MSILKTLNELELANNSVLFHKGTRDNSNIDVLPRNFIIQTWHNAVDHHLHTLWQEYLGILHIPQFYPKEQYNGGLPPEITKSIKLSIKIFDCLERMQPHGVCLTCL